MKRLSGIVMQRFARERVTDEFLMRMLKEGGIQARKLEVECG